MDIDPTTNIVSTIEAYRKANQDFQREVTKIANEIIRDIAARYNEDMDISTLPEPDQTRVAIAGRILNLTTALNNDLHRIFPK